MLVEALNPLLCESICLPYQKTNYQQKKKKKKNEAWYHRVIFQLRTTDIEEIIRKEKNTYENEFEKAKWYIDSELEGIVDVRSLSFQFLFNSDSIIFFWIDWSKSYLVLNFLILYHSFDLLQLHKLVLALDMRRVLVVKQRERRQALFERKSVLQHWVEQKEVFEGLVGSGYEGMSMDNPDENENDK